MHSVEIYAPPVFPSKAYSLLRHSHLANAEMQVRAAESRCTLARTGGRFRSPVACAGQAPSKSIVESAPRSTIFFPSIRKASRAHGCSQRSRRLRWGRRAGWRNLPPVAPLSGSPEATLSRTECGPASAHCMLGAATSQEHADRGTSRTTGTQASTSPCYSAHGCSRAALPLFASCGQDLSARSERPHAGEDRRWPGFRALGSRYGRDKRSINLTHVPATLP
jgi:hypothetical protein